MFFTKPEKPKKKSGGLVLPPTSTQNFDTKRGRDMTYRFWVFTCNLDEEERPEDFALLPCDRWPDCVRFCTYSLELGETGNLHFQGYIELVRQQRLSWMKKLEGLGAAHFEQRRGTQEQAIAYAEKVGRHEKSV